MHGNPLQPLMFLPRMVLLIRLLPLTLAAGCAGAPINSGGLQVTPPGADSSASTVITREYRIGPEDLIEISVLGEEDLKKQVLVGPDGAIAFPMIGQLQAAGKTVGELEREVTARLKEQILDPVVTITVAKPAGYQIYVIGKVNKPGQFVVERSLHALQALALAGGLTPFADQDDIKILRRGGAGDQVFPFDYSAVQHGQKLEQNIVLQSGDVIVVP